MNTTPHTTTNTATSSPASSTALAVMARQSVQVPLCYTEPDTMQVHTTVPGFDLFLDFATHPLTSQDRAWGERWMNVDLARRLDRTTHVPNRRTSPTGPVIEYPTHAFPGEVWTDDLGSVAMFVFEREGQPFRVGAYLPGGDEYRWRCDGTSHFAAEPAALIFPLLELLAPHPESPDAEAGVGTWLGEGHLYGPDGLVDYEWAQQALRHTIQTWTGYTDALLALAGLVTHSPVEQPVSVSRGLAVLAWAACGVAMDDIETIAHVPTFVHEGDPVAGTGDEPVWSYPLDVWNLVACGWSVEDAALLRLASLGHYEWSFPQAALFTEWWRDVAPMLPGMTPDQGVAWFVRALPDHGLEHMYAASEFTTTVRRMHARGVCDSNTYEVLLAVGWCRDRTDEFLRGLTSDFLAYLDSWQALMSLNNAAWHIAAGMTQDQVRETHEWAARSGFGRISGDYLAAMAVQLAPRSQTISAFLDSQTATS